MRDMFFNYDNNVMVDNVFTLPPQMPPKNLDYGNAPYIVRTINGDAVGIEAKANSLFRLFFNLSCNKSPAVLADLLARADIRFEVLNRRHQVVATFPVDVYLDDPSLSVEIWTIDKEQEEESEPQPEPQPDPNADAETVPTSNDDVIKISPILPGIYKMNLYMITDSFKYTIFSENDGILSIK